jgi:hypothetical protein
LLVPAYGSIASGIGSDYAAVGSIARFSTDERVS